MSKPNRKVVRAAIRGSVPEGKLRKAHITLADKALLKNSPIGGFTQYDQKSKEVVKLGAPLEDSAEGITVRGHETRHATRHKPTRKKPATELELTVGQIVDDVNIESSELPNLSGNDLMEAYRRAHLTTAVSGLRAIVNTARKVKSGAVPDTAQVRNGQLIHSLRVLSMLRHYAVSRREILTRARGVRKLRALIGERMISAIYSVMHYAKNRRTRAKAIGMMLALLENPELEQYDDDEKAPPGDPDNPLAPVSAGSAIEGKMDIADLMPKSMYCAKEKSVSTRYTPSGVLINATRYISAIVSGDANGLFSRRVKNKPGGCVVIDASGSMGATARNLSEICKLVPTATVGYYSGYGSGGRGVLCVYAKDGKRFSGELPEDKLHGGNAVDLPAIQWMMKHPKPWTLVSDLQFCGGVLGSEAVAHAIVERAMARGDLKVYRSLDEAYSEFGGKGELKN